MSSVAELKKKFQGGNSKVILTPEQHAAALRQKERNEVEAVRIAKARAARYNLTLRSLELANADKNKSKQTLSGRRASRAPRPVQVKVADIQKGPVADALSHKRSPSVAKEVVEAMAEHVQAAMQKAESKTAEELEAEAKKEEEAHAKAEAEAQAQAAAEAAAAAANTAAEAAAAEAKAAAEAAAAEAKAAADAEAAAKAEEAVDHGASFEMTTLQQAIETGDSAEINKAIVTEFLQEHAPTEATPEKVEELLSKNEGKEAELMQELAKKYDDPAQEEISTLKEVIEKVEQTAPPPAAEAETATEEKEPPTAAEEAVTDDLMAEAERIKEEEEARVQGMDDNERQRYMEQLAEAAKHNEDKDRMLKSQLNVYTSGGPNILAGKGRGRGRGKRPVSTTPGGAVEYIVNATNEGGEWSVNNE